MYIVTIDAEKCTGDAECVDVCPSGVFKMNGDKSDPFNMQECMGCMSCVEICPAGAITVNEI